MKISLARVTLALNLLFVAIFCLWGQKVTAQALPTFSCTGEVYQVQSGQLRIFDPISSSYQNVGSNQGSYNATGFNVLDGYAYGSQGGNVIRIGSNGNREIAFSGISGSFSGDVDRSNNYWLRSNNNAYRRINLATGNVTTVSFSGPGGGAADVAYLEFGGKEYLIGFSGSRMYRYNITDGTKQNINVSGGMPGGGYGATWTDFNARIFTFNNNTGEIWEVFDYDTNSPTTSFVAQADPSGNNDGFSCPQGPFPNLPPLAFDDDFVTPVNVPVVDNVITDHGNGTDNDPEGGPIFVNTTPVTGPTNGTVVLNTDGTFTYTPDPNFIGTDTFVYEIEDATGLTAQATVTITIEGEIDFDIVKSVAAGPNPVTDAGTVLTYEVEISNEGDIPLTDVVATDTAPDGSIVTLSGQSETGGAPNVSGQLDVGETWTFTYTYTVTQDDIDSGAPLVNSVTASTDETGATEKTDTTSTPINQLIDYTLVKTVDTATLSAPGELTYEIVVTNTGEVTLTGTSLSDTLAQGANGLVLTSGPTLSGDTDNDAELDVDEVWTYTATFDATQAEIDDGGTVVNTAEFSTTEAGTRSDTAETQINATPAMTVTKVTPETNITAPDEITYQITITNDGEVSLTGVNLIDQLTQGATGLTLTTGPTLSGDLDSDLEIDVDETWVYSATFDATQTQIDDGTDIVNQVTVQTNELPDDSAQATTAITQDPSYSLAKRVDQTALSSTGTLRYEIEVVNDGNVSLTGISFNDQITQNGIVLAPTTGPVLTGDTDLDGELDVGESWLYVITLDVEQGEIDDGSDIVNNASFTPAEAPAQTGDATTTITQTQGLDLSKAVATGQPTSFAAVGDTINFTFVVTNTGNTTRSGPILINDDQIGNGLVCQAGDLAPNAIATCTFPWTATQQDLNAGSVTNTASAIDDDGVVSADQQATVTATQSPQIEIEKSLTGTPPNFQPNETLNYTFLVTNTGNVTLQAPITVTDNLLTNVSCDAVPAGGLPPFVAGSTPTTANSISCTGSYIITLADVNVGSISNVATVSAFFNGTDVEDQDEAIFPVDAAPKLDLAKSTDPDPASFAALGDTITYTYAVTNQAPVGGSGVAITQPITIDDDKLSGPFVCYDPNAAGNGPVLVNQTITCDAEYTVTQADLDAESVTNTATANTSYTAADGSMATIISPPESVTVNSEITPSMSLQKSADAGAPSPAEEGDVIPYTIVATNDGEQTLSNVTITDPQLGALSCTPTPAPVTLAPTETLTCTGGYTVTQADIDDQTVGDPGTATFTNTASVAANDPSGTAIDPVSASEDHPLDPAAPALTILKELIPDPGTDPAYENVGDVLRYRMTVTNSGNTTINTISVTDSLVSGTCSIATLAPGAQDTTCIFNYVVDQDDLDRGTVENTGEVTGQPANPGSDPVSDTDDLTSNGPDQMPLLEVIKDGVLDLGPDSVASVGDIITYQITVTNIGNVTISDTSVSDPVVAPLVYAAGDDPDADNDINMLAPGDSAVVTATYTLDQDDVNLGSVTNTAQASGFDPNGDPVSDTSDSADPNDGAGGDDPTVTDFGRTPMMTLVKSVSDATDVTEGTVLTYTYVVQNTGNVTLSNVTVTDQHTSASGTAALAVSPNGGVVASLLPDATATFTATYTVTQDDIDSGADLTNTATVSANGPTGTTVPDAMDDAVVDLDDQSPAIEVRKSASDLTGVTAGTVLTYTYDVENTGNVTLTNVALDDQHTSASGTSALTISPNGGTVATLAPTQIVTFTATYTVTQEDVDAGLDLTNTVTVTSESPVGTTPPSDTDDETVDLEDRTPAIEAIKTVRSQTGSTAGDTVVFEITVNNTGNVTLDGVTLTDTLRRADGSVISPAPSPIWDTVDDGDASVLDVGEDWVYTLTYVLTQDDIDAGGITNSVLVQATGPDGTGVNDVSDNGTGDGNDPTPVLISPTPSIEAVKVITSSTTTVGETVRFEITVTNTGNVTLTGVAIASDQLTRNDAAATPLTLIGPAFVGADAGSGEGTLLVGETANYNASYVLTQDDIDAGGITNTATATGTPPTGGPVTDVSDDDGAGDDPTVLTIAPTPSILFDKRLAAGFGPSFDEDGQVLTFEFEITNTGNVTLSPPYAISDPLITDQGGTISCPATDIAPDASIICTGDYQTTQDDVNNGGFTNVATATVGDAAPVTDDAFVPSVQNPALELVKDAPSIDPIDFVTGLEVTYTFTSTNTGNTTLIDPITISDGLFGPSDYTCAPWPAAGLAPDETYVCTAVYTVTSEDVALAVVVNNAVASSGDVDSEIASNTIPNNGEPALEIVKSLIQANQPDGTDSGTLTFDEVGDQLVYQFEVTNSGNFAFARPVEVTDTLFATPITCFAPTGADPELAGGEVAICTATYTVTQDDLDANEVLNEAFASTEFGSIPTIVLSLPDDVTVAADATPGVTIEKEVDALNYAAIGDVLTYSITVTNTGNQTLSEVAVTDPLLPALVCEIDTLPVDGVLTCSGSYTVDQGDIDAGSVTNVATAGGIDPNGDAIDPQDGTATSDGPAIDPTLTLEKVANPDPFGAVGSTVTYLFRVTNDSIFTITDVTVTDVLPNGAGTFTCDVGTLLPGEVSEGCSVGVLVTQEDVNAGELVNTASVAGTGPQDTPATADDTVTTGGPEQVPGIELTKTVDVPATTPGSVVTYTFSVVNTGNVSLDNIDIGDDLSRNDGTPLDLTTPVTLQQSGGFATGDLNTNGLLDPAEVWTFQSTYEITQDDVNAGGFSNSATVFGTSPEGDTVFDASDDGNDGDGDSTGDPTEVPIDINPVLDVEKVITQTASAVGETVVFEIRAANRGSVDLFNVVPSDTLTRDDGTDLSGSITGPTRTGNPSDNGDTTLSPGEVWTWSVSYVLDQDDIDVGGIANVATVDAEDVGGIPIADSSDDGDDGDGNTADDPTALAFESAPGLDVTKVADSVGTRAGETVVFVIEALNTGNVRLSNFTLDDTMTNGDGTALAPLDVVVSGLTNGMLDPGDTATFTVTYTLTQSDIDSGSISNTATVNSTAPTGGPVFDVSDNGDDTDGNAEDDPTVVTLDQNPELTVTKTTGASGSLISGSLFTQEFLITLANTGNATITAPTLIDDIEAGFTISYDPSVAAISTGGVTIAPVVTAVTGTTAVTGNANYDGDAGGDANLILGGAMAPGDEILVTFTVLFDASQMANALVNEVTASGTPPMGSTLAVNGTDENGNPTTDGTAASMVMPSRELTATKSVLGLSDVRIGDTVTYQLGYDLAVGSADLTNLTFVDLLPVGVSYVPGSAMISRAGGPETALEPATAGSSLTWAGEMMAGGTTTIITFNGRVGPNAPTGNLVNETFVRGPTGEILSNRAEAIVRRVPEHVFDCSDVIGTVFEDINRNGYQDGPARPAGVTNQGLFGGKGKLAAPANTNVPGERGLPGVRIATVNGTLITTDEHGRFHVPCAELPSDIGTNFLLKVDERSLPSGYRITTENPRVVRLTAGKFAKMNFGASIGRVIDINLSAKAFVDGAEPTDKLRDAVRNLSRTLQAQPSVVRLSYAANTQAEVKLGRARMRQVEKLLKAEWRRTGTYKLTIEKTIKRRR